MDRRHVTSTRKKSLATVAIALAITLGSFGAHTVSGPASSSEGTAHPPTSARPARPAHPTPIGITPASAGGGPVEANKEGQREATVPTLDQTQTPAEPAAPVVLPAERTEGVDAATGAKFLGADPDLVRDGDVWRLYTTTSLSGFTHVPVWESEDLVTWTLLGEALPRLPAWAGPFRTWAPDVAHIGGQWVLFFSAPHRETDLMCIGHAVADDSAGPFVAFEKPIVCELDEGGSIDPMVFQDGAGRAWLLWKVDGNAIDAASQLRSQRLSSDGLQLIEDPSTLLTVEQWWEAPLIEQPELLEVDGRLHLFYAGGWFNQPGYTVGHALCESVTGPCARTNDDGRFIRTEGEVKGPGAISVLETDAGLIGVYHAWTGQVNVKGEFRSLIVEPLTIVDGLPARGPAVA